MRYAVWYGCVFQSRTAIKCVITNGVYAGWNVNSFEPAAVGKGTVCDAFGIRAQNGGFKIGGCFNYPAVDVGNAVFGLGTVCAAVKGPICNEINALRDVHRFETHTVLKSPAGNQFGALGNDDGFKASAAGKGVGVDSGDAVWQANAFELFTAAECAHFKSGVMGQIYLNEASAAIKQIAGKNRDAVRNGDFTE